MQLHRPVRIDERQSGIVQQLTPLHLQPALPQRGPQAVEQQSINSQRSMTTPFDCHDANQRLVIALGDPAGIGMEVTLKALADPQRPAHINPLLVGCRASLERTAQLLRERTQAPVADPDDLEVDDQPIPGGPLEPGTAGSISGAASFQWLTRQCSWCKRARDVHW